MIVILDLQFTLVSNGLETMNRAAPHVAREEYRKDLIELVKPHHVILVTVRADRYREQTLARIQSLTRWQPQEAYFNDRGWPAPRWKDHVLVQLIWPRHGRDAAYVAVESNDETAKMYVAHSVLTLKAWGGQHRSSRGSTRQPGQSCSRPQSDAVQGLFRF